MNLLIKKSVVESMPTSQLETFIRKRKNLIYLLHIQSGNCRGNSHFTNLDCNYNFVFSIYIPMFHYILFYH